MERNFIFWACTSKYEIKNCGQCSRVGATVGFPAVFPLLGVELRVDSDGDAVSDNFGLSPSWIGHHWRPTAAVEHGRPAQLVEGRQDGVNVNIFYFHFLRLLFVRRRVRCG